MTTGIKVFNPKVRVTDKSAKSPWFNRTAEKAIRNKLLAWKRFKSCKTSIISHNYIELRNVPVATLRKVRKQHEKRLLRENRQY